MKERRSSLKIKLIRIQLFLCLLLLMTINPVSVKMIFSKDHALNPDSYLLSLSLTCFLFIMLIIYSLSLFLIMKGKTRFPDLVVNLSVSALVFFLLLVFSEILFRTLFAGHTKAQLYGMNEHFGMIWQKSNLDIMLKSREYKVRFQTNNVGLRDTRDFRGPNENEIRIINLGDSFIQAAQVSLENSMTYILEKKLNSQDAERKFRVFNLGTSGCDPEYERKFMAENGRVFSPRFLFWFIYIGNDIVASADFNEPPTRLQRVVKVANARAQEASSLLRFFEERAKDKREFPMGRPCQPFDGKSKEESTNLFLKEYNPRIEKAYQALWEEILQMAAICEREDIVLRIVLIPTKEQVDPDRLSEVLKYFGYDEDNLDLLKPQRLVGEFLSENKIRYIDLLETLAKANRSRKTYFDIDSHWNEYGNEVVADDLFKYFCREFLGVGAYSRP